MAIRNIAHGPRLKVPAFRKIAVGSWRHPRDPSSYATLDLAADPAVAFLRGVRSETPLTLTHFTLKILGYCVEKQPDLNRVLLRGSFYPRADIGFFVSVLVRDRGAFDLSGFALPGVPGLALPAIAARCAAETRCLRRGGNEQARRVSRRMRGLPSWLAGPFFRAMEFVQFTLNLAPPRWRIPPDRFGTAIVTDVGALGLRQAFVPLPAFSRCPFMVCIGKPRPSPWVEGDRVVPRQAVTITFTVDHRYIDGAHGAVMLKRFQRVFEAPEHHPDAFEGARGP